MRETLQRYGDVIETLTREVKRQIGGLDAPPPGETLLELVEETFFRSPLVERIAICHLSEVVEAIWRRVRSRYGILAPLLEDEEINEIMINGPQHLFIEKRRRILEVDDAFLNEEELEGMIRMFASDVHREVNEAHPIVDARLENGFRVNGVLRTIALNGPILTIRKFAAEPIALNDLIAYGSLSKDCGAFLSELVRCGYNVFISGGTSSGKTTFLEALAAAIQPKERVIIIEDSAELALPHLENKVHMECRSANSLGKGGVSMDQLIRTSLRMRPDRIVVGEVRGHEVIDMIQAMSTGHDGSMSTGHGNSIKGMLNRLETMYLMDAQTPMHAIRSQIANAIDIFVHLRRDSSGRRGVVEVAELEGFDGTDYLLNYLYVLDDAGKLQRTEHALKNDGKLRRGAQDGL